MDQVWIMETTFHTLRCPQEWLAGNCDTSPFTMILPCKLNNYQFIGDLPLPCVMEGTHEDTVKLWTQTAPFWLTTNTPHGWCFHTFAGPTVVWTTYFNAKTVCIHKIIWPPTQTKSSIIQFWAGYFMIFLYLVCKLLDSPSHIKPLQTTAMSFDCFYFPQYSTLWFSREFPHN